MKNWKQNWKMEKLEEKNWEEKWKIESKSNYKKD